MNSKQIQWSRETKDNRFHEIIMALLLQSVAWVESSNAQAGKQAETIIGAKLGAMC